MVNVVNIGVNIATRQTRCKLLKNEDPVNVVNVGESLLRPAYFAACQLKRLTATIPKPKVNSSMTATGASAAERPRPRQVMASMPSIAHRVGITMVNFCSHCGKTNVGTHA